MPDKLITLENLSTFKDKIEQEIDAKQDALPPAVNGEYLHANSSTGEIEWAAVPTDNQTIKVDGSPDVSFGANDVVELVAGTNVSLAGDANAKTITISATDTTYSDATTNASGLMSAEDKTKLNGIETGAQVNPSAYLKSATTNGNTLTLTKQDNTDVTFTPTFSEAHVGDVVSVGATSGSNIAIGGTSANPTVGVANGYSIPSDTDQSAWSAKQNALTFDTAPTQNSTNPVTSGGVYTAISNLPTPMVFKGTLGSSGATISSLPTASSSNEGYTYKVITAGTYASQVAKIGDVFVSNGSEWVLIPSGDDVEDTWRSISINDTELLGNGISTGTVNFVSGTNVTVSGSGNNITVSATDTTYSVATSATAGLVKSSTTGTTANRDYNVEVKSDGTMKVNVPWTDTTYDMASTADIQALFSTTISFTIAPQNQSGIGLGGEPIPITNDPSYSYQAESGMTWAQWIASEYNTYGEWSISVTSVINNAYNPHNWLVLDNVVSTDTIQSGATYTYHTQGGGSND